jgi:hypothetical protein
MRRACLTLALIAANDVSFADCTRATAGKSATLRGVVA